MFSASYRQYIEPIIRCWLPDPASKLGPVMEQIVRNPMDFEHRYDDVSWPWTSACPINPEPTQEWIDKQQQKKERAERYRIEDRESKMRRILNKLKKKHEQ